jgi:cytoskeletal protein RodZ
VLDKSAAVVPITPRSPRESQKPGSTALRIAPADFGDRLLRGREQKNRTLKEIADTTKVSIHQLRALERGDLHRLPGGFYRRAIVRQYAGAVGLNVEETLRDLASVLTEVDVDVQRLEAVDHPRGDAGSSPFATALWSSAAALVVVGAVAAAATAWYRAGATAPAADAPVTAASAPTPEADAPAVALVAATEAVPANAGNIELATEPAVVQTQTVTGSGAAADATEGELRITSEPLGAIVTVNGIGWGTTPVTIRYMPFGKKLVRATKPGYVSAHRGFDFVPDRRVRSVRIQLSPESPDAP